MGNCRLLLFTAGYCWLLRVTACYCGLLRVTVNVVQSYYEWSVRSLYVCLSNVPQAAGYSARFMCSRVRKCTAYGQAPVIVTSSADFAT